LQAFSGRLSAGVRIIGHDIHRASAVAAAWENGKLKRLGRIDIAALSVGGPCIDFVGERHPSS
jgi:hypothetical protein